MLAMVMLGACAASLVHPRAILPGFADLPAQPDHGAPKDECGADYCGLRFYSEDVELEPIVAAYQEELQSRGWTMLRGNTALGLVMRGPADAVTCLRLAPQRRVLVDPFVRPWMEVSFMKWPCVGVPGTGFDEPPK
jgi:hypothetical protein